ncbi:hypothetical protein, partial [Alkalicoccobacillus porphyridii]|uniref:hypothetical protein n=1 Tax=Alkalicoccobacillus porphyridii TaxID=2597270 RepID=UPI001C8F4136
KSGTIPNSNQPNNCITKTLTFRGHYQKDRGCAKRMKMREKHRVMRGNIKPVSEKTENAR